MPVMPDEAEKTIPEPFIKESTREIKEEFLKEIAPEPEKKVNPPPEKQARVPAVKKRDDTDLIRKTPAMVETKDKMEEDLPAGELQEPEYASPGFKESRATEKTELDHITQRTVFPETISIREAVPAYKENPEPAYPKRARKRGIEGSVLLDVFVGREGTVKEIRLSESSGYSVLDRAATEAVKKWIFTPGMRGGEAVEMWVKVPIRFRLE